MSGLAKTIWGQQVHLIICTVKCSCWRGSRALCGMIVTRTSNSMIKPRELWMCVHTWMMSCDVADLVR